MVYRPFRVGKAGSTSAPVTTYLAAVATILAFLIQGAAGFYFGFKAGRRTMLRDLRPYLPDGHEFRDPLA